MKYRFLGKSQISASIIGLGTYTFGGGEDQTSSNDKNSIDTIHAALDHGITLIDTAPSYGWGHCERVVGEAIRGRRDNVVIATKCGVWWQDKRGSYNGIKDGKDNYISLHPDTIKIEVESSLKNLGTDYIDLLQCHKPAIPPVETPISETMDCLMRLKKEGKVRAIGVSNVSLEQLKDYDAVGELSTDQFKYSMLSRDSEKDILPYCDRNNISTLTYWSLEYGLLTGQITTDRVFEEDDFRLNAGKWLPWFKKENIIRITDMFASWRDILERHRCTIAQLTLAWTAAQPGATHILCGARNVAQSSQNAGAGSLSLEEVEIQRMRNDVISLGDPT